MIFMDHPRRMGKKWVPLLIPILGCSYYSCCFLFYILFSYEHYSYMYNLSRILLSLFGNSLDRTWFKNMTKHMFWLLHTCIQHIEDSPKMSCSRMPFVYWVKISSYPEEFGEFILDIPSCGQVNSLNQ